MNITSSRRRSRRRKKRKHVPAYILVIVGFLIAICLIFYIRNAFPSSSYTIYGIDKDGKKESIQTTRSLHEAKKIMFQSADIASGYNAEIENGNKVRIGVAYGIVNFRTKDCKTNTDYTLASTKKSGYTNGCYGSDAVFLDISDDGEKVKFQLSGVIAWVNLKDVEIMDYIDMNSSTYISSYRVVDKSLTHYVSTKSTSQSVFAIPLGTINLANGTYYSYDGHFFYSSFVDMSDDVRKASTSKSINAKNSYYYPYQYISHRSISSYTANDIDSYIKQLGFDSKESSLLYNSGQSFVKAQNQYHTNAIMMLSLAINESDFGRSEIAKDKNNLFGHAAYDEAPSKKANQYKNVNESILTHAKVFLDEGYLNTNNFRYYGSFFGDKASGMNVKYASDPYWGEKAAANYEEFERNMGFKDSTIQTKIITARTNVYQEPSYDSKVLYEIKALPSSILLYGQPVQKDDTLWFPIQNDNNSTDNPVYITIKN